MDDALKVFAFGFILGVLLMTGVSALVGGWTINDIYREAVEAGVAHYEADPKTGEVNFVWKEAGE